MPLFHIGFFISILFVWIGGSLALLPRSCVEHVGRWQWNPQKSLTKPRFELSDARDNLPVEVNRYMESELNNMIESMDVNDKYSFLIQSISTKILESSAKKADAETNPSSRNDANINELKSLCSLYLEMFQVMNIPPTQKSSQSLIDASASFRDCAKLGYSLQLAKAGIDHPHSLSLNHLHGVIQVERSRSLEVVWAFLPSQRRMKRIVFE